MEQRARDRIPRSGKSSFLLGIHIDLTFERFPGDRLHHCFRLMGVPLR